MGYDLPELCKGGYKYPLLRGGINHVGTKGAYSNHFGTKGAYSKRPSAYDFSQVEATSSNDFKIFLVWPTPMILIPYTKQEMLYDCFYILSAISYAA